MGVGATYWSTVYPMVRDVEVGGVESVQACLALWAALHGLQGRPSAFQKAKV